ncbi:MAG: hypothetical protein R3181_12400, partial [Rubricoccaceae bacterium]|nr:hypothetical protein [Rubricoccaceae bacterium]
MKTPLQALLLCALLVLMAPLSQAQISLPITFEDPIDYELTDFGGNASSLVPDPEDPANTVVESVRTAAAECFAGTTVAEVSGFTEPLPFEPGMVRMNVRVWSPLAGVPVRFKVEEVGDPTVSVEAEVLTTVAGAWDTLVYDFIEDKVEGTADIDFGAVYNKASIFFNFQCPDTDPVPEATYYWDDVAFGDVQTDVEPSLEPGGSTIIPSTGGMLLYEITLTNTTDQAQTFKTRLDASLPDNSTFRVRGTRTVTLAPNETLGPLSSSRNLPAGAPEGDYTLVLTLFRDGELLASDSFPFEKEPGPSPISLPITFEDPIDYELTDFGGNASSLVPDPEDPANTVVESVRTAA